MGSWTNSGGDENWVYDATGAAHDGGSAKATHDGSANTIVRFRMYQGITINNTAEIDTADMDAWIQWNDAWPAQNDEVDNSTAEFWVQLKDPNGNFYGVGHTTKNFGSLSSITLCNSVNVKPALQAGGDGAWRVYLTCDIYRANLAHGWLVTWFDDLSLDVTWQPYGSTTETFTVTESTSTSATLGVSATDTVTMSDGVGGIPAATNFRYYLGSYDGKVYLEHPAYYHDNDVAMPVHLITKVTDFSEEVPEAHNKYKTIYFVRLWYIDKTASTTITLSVSNDEGTTWTTNTKTIGTGSELTKSVDFFYPISGHTFQFKVENESGDKDFQWIGLESYYKICGEYFGIN